MSDLKLATDLAALILYLHEKTLRAAEGGPEKAEEWVKLRADYVSVCSTGAAVLAAALQDLSDSERGMREALEPSGDTKAAYSGEFKFKSPGGRMQYTVPWETIKEIMAAISARAALSPKEGG